MLRRLILGCILLGVPNILGLVGSKVYAECSTIVSPEQALSIANLALKNSGLDPAEFDAHLTQDAKGWEDHINRSIDGRLGEEAKREAEQLESAMRGHKNFFSIDYSPKPHPQGHMVLGGGSVLLDADTGDVLIIQPGHRKAIFPKAAPKKNNKPSESCP